MIDFIVNFDGFTQDQRYNISFDLSFNKNSLHNEQPLIKLLNELKSTKSEGLEEFLLSNFEECFDLINHFGIGLIIFPSLILRLGGSYSISLADSSPQVCSTTLTRNVSPIAQMTPNTLSPSDPKNFSGRMAQQTSNMRIKIAFKIPFEQASMSKKCLSPYFPFNPYKEEENGKAIFKSPLVKKSNVLSRLTG